jgi:hypothetical protein
VNRRVVETIPLCHSIYSLEMIVSLVPPPQRPFEVVRNVDASVKACLPEADAPSTANEVCSHSSFSKFDCPRGLLNICEGCELS